MKRELAAKLPGTLVIDGYRVVGDRRPGPDRSRRPAARSSRAAALRGERRDHRARRRPPAGRRSASSASSPAAATSRSATTRTRRRPRRRSRWSTACAGRSPATTPASRPTARITRARARLGVDQHRRREGVPRRGRGGAEGRTPPCSTRSSSACPTSAGASGSSRVVQPRDGRAARARRPRRARPRRTSPATRRRARSCSSTTIVRSPSGKPDYRWAQATAMQQLPPHDSSRYRPRAPREPPRDETSPYLRQHADNPVDWYPWGDEAFAAARAPRTSRSCCRSATRRATGAT